MCVCVCVCVSPSYDRFAHLVRGNLQPINVSVSN